MQMNKYENLAIKWIYKYCSQLETDDQIRSHSVTIAKFIGVRPMRPQTLACISIFIASDILERPLNFDDIKAVTNIKKQRFIGWLRELYERFDYDSFKNR